MSLFEDKDVLNAFAEIAEEPLEEAPPLKEEVDEINPEDSSPEPTKKAELDPPQGEQEDPVEDPVGDPVEDPPEDFAGVYKDLYDEDLPDEPQPHEEYLDRVSAYEDELINRSQLLMDEQKAFNAKIKEFDPKYTSHNGVSVEDMNEQQLLSFSNHLYDTGGDEDRAMLTHVLQQARAQQSLVSRVEEFNQTLDGYEWEASIADLVKKRPEVYNQLPKLQKGLEEALKKVTYQPNDKPFKEKLIKSVLRSMAHRVKPPQKPKQTPEAEVVKQSPKVSTSKKSAPSTDELADMWLNGEYNPFEQLV